MGDTAKEPRLVEAEPGTCEGLVKFCLAEAQQMAIGKASSFSLSIHLYIFRFLLRETLKVAAVNVGRILILVLVEDFCVLLYCTWVALRWKIVEGLLWPSNRHRPVSFTGVLSIMPRRVQSRHLAGPGGSLASSKHPLT